MANFTRFSSSLPSVDGRHIVTRFVTVDEYTTISNVSNPTSAGFDMTSANYDADFLSTLYYIRENP